MKNKMAKRAKVISRKEDACCSVVADMYDDLPNRDGSPGVGLPPLPQAKKTRLLQADVDAELYDAVRAVMDNREIKLRAVAD